MNYYCLNVYNINQAVITLLSDIEGVKLLIDDKLGGATYIFYLVELDFKIIKRALLSSYYEEIPYPLTSEQVETMLSKSEEFDLVEVGDFVFLKGFGTIPMLVESVQEDLLKVGSIYTGCMMSIKTGIQFCEIAKEPEPVYKYYNCEIAIDCDLIPFIDHPLAFELTKKLMIAIVYDLAGLIEGCSIGLYNPTLFQASVGKSLGLPIHNEPTNLVSGSNSNIQYNVKKREVGYIKGINYLTGGKGDIKSTKVDLTEVSNLFRYCTSSGALTSSEAYYLINRLYFSGYNTLDINLGFNPLEEDR